MTHDQAQAALKRMLANGPLTGLPVKPADVDVLLALAALRFAPGREYREREVNDLLRDWLRTFCAPFGIDHVTFRRCLVDARILLRDRHGSAYQVAPAKIDRALASLDPARLLADVRDKRAARKRAHQRPAP
jgi:hypothetical protein